MKDDIKESSGPCPPRKPKKLNKKAEPGNILTRMARLLRDGQAVRIFYHPIELKKRLKNIKQRYIAKK